MGSILQAKCICGYESEEFFLGGGMSDFGDKLEVPYYCDNCSHVGSLNLFKRLTATDMVDGVESELRKRITCKKCKRKVQYYGKLKKDFAQPTTDEDKFVFEWGHLFSDIGQYSLSATMQYCPTCKKVTLLFYDIGCWD